MNGSVNAMQRLRLTCPLSQWTGIEGRCQWCNLDLTGVKRRRTWCSDQCHRDFERHHIWSRARATAKRRAKYKCLIPGCPSTRDTLEVNHINPLVGSGYGPSCAHHQEPFFDDKTGRMVGGLEVLCHKHHLMVTKQQRAERKAAKDAQIADK